MTISNLAKLADDYARAKAMADEVAKHLDSLKREILATGLDEIKGENFAVKVSKFEQSRLDTKAIRAILSEQQIEAYSVTSEITKLTVKASLNI
jgi:hypothetical protein